MQHLDDLGYWQPLRVLKQLLTHSCLFLVQFFTSVITIFSIIYGTFYCFNSKIGTCHTHFSMKSIIYGTFSYGFTVKAVNCTPGGIRTLYFTWVTAKFLTKKPTRVGNVNGIEVVTIPTCRPYFLDYRQRLSFLRVIPP